MNTSAAISRPARSHIANVPQSEPPRGRGGLRAVEHLDSAEPDDAPHSGDAPESGGAPDLTVIRCENTADFLAALPFVTGFTAQESMFVVLFQGRRSGDVLRMDMPESEESPAQTRLLLDGLVHLLRETGAGHGSPAIVFTTSRSFAECAATPWRSFARRLAKRFAQEEWTLRELAVIAADGWAGLLGARAGEQRSLDEILRSPVARRASFLPRQPPQLDAFGALPEADQARAEEVASHLEALERRRATRLAHPAQGERPRSNSLWMHGIARVAGACFGAPEPGISPAAADPEHERVDPRLVARLIDAAQTPECWLVLALTALTRTEFVVSLADECEPDRFCGMPIGIEPGEQGGAEWSVAQLLLSLSHETPEPRKLRWAIHAIADAASHAPERRRPGLLALLAWAWWMLGMQTVAHRLVQQSLALDARHELTLMVDRLVQAPPASRVDHLRRKFRR